MGFDSAGAAWAARRVVQVFMVGIFPVLIDVSVEPWSWVEASASAAFDGSIAVQYKGSLEYGVAFDFNSGSAKGVSKVNMGTVTVLPLAEGSIAMRLAARVGPV